MLANNSLIFDRQIKRVETLQEKQKKESWSTQRIGFKLLYGSNANAKFISHFYVSSFSSSTKTLTQHGIY